MLDLICTFILIGTAAIAGFFTAQAITWCEQEDTK